MSRAPSRFRFGIRAMLVAMAMVGIAIVSMQYVRDVREAKRRATILQHGSGNAILVADGEIVLVRRGNAHGAISFDQQTIREDADFNWRYREDGRGALSSADPAVKAGGGHTSTHGGTVVRFGPFAIEWSGCDNGYGWLYHDRETPAYRLCPTSVHSFERIDAADAKWQYVDRPVAQAPAYLRGFGK